MDNRDIGRMNLSSGHRAPGALRRSLLLVLMLGLGISPSRTTSIPADSLFTPADFGYQRLTINGQPALGHRPLLVILANFAGGNPFAHTLDYFDNLVFNWFQKQSLNGYFLANSNGRFLWSRAGRGIVGPVQMTADQRSDAVKNDTLYINMILKRVIELGLFNFVQFDANGDYYVTQDELGLLIITNDGDTAGAARATGLFQLSPGADNITRFLINEPGLPNVAVVNHQAGFVTMAHEVSHILGAVDLYGSNCLSQNLTLMSCTGGPADDMSSYHLDPWHKIQLGWDEPRVEEITAQSWVYLPVTQVSDPHAPLILYDSARGPSEYFILECRNPASAKGGGYDDQVAGTGLAIWHVIVDENKNPIILPALCRGPVPAQSNWRWCSKCQGLHYIADWRNPSPGPCPAGGTHEYKTSGGYSVVLGVTSAPGQHDWRLCQKCQGLFYAPSLMFDYNPFRCPAGGEHDGSRSGDYSLVMNDPTSPGQYDWQLCRKCQGLFYGPNQSSSRCPVGGQHESGSSAQYSVLCDGIDVGVFAEGSPNLGRGYSTLWSNVLTPPLQWLDGTQIIPSKIWVVSSYSSWGIIVRLGNY